MVGKEFQNYPGSAIDSYIIKYAELDKNTLFQKLKSKQKKLNQKLNQIVALKILIKDKE